MGVTFQASAALLTALDAWTTQSLGGRLKACGTGSREGERLLLGVYSTEELSDGRLHPHEVVQARL